MTPSPRCLNLIRQFEGLRLFPYRDQAGVLTIGYGHTGPDVVMGLSWTAEQAWAALQADAQTAAAAVALLVRVTLNQNQFDALVDFVFNLGATRLAGSTLLQYVNEENFTSAAGEFGKWDHVGTVINPGLQRRREAERELFLGA